MVVYADLSILALALPTIGRTFHASSSSVLWVINAYALSRAVFVFASGKISDLFTHKRTFLYALILFSLSSIACALSLNIGWLILSRIAQGLSATLVYTSGMSLIADVFPKECRGKIIGKLLTSSLVVMAVSPVIGGVLVQYLSWRLIFILLGGICFLAMLVYHFVTIEGKENKPAIKHFDIIGFLYIAAASLSITILMRYVPQIHWFSISGMVLTILTIVFFIVFFKRQKKVQYPIINMSFFFTSKF